MWIDRKIDDISKQIIEKQNELKELERMKESMKDNRDLWIAIENAGIDRSVMDGLYAGGKMTFSELENRILQIIAYWDMMSEEPFGFDVNKYREYLDILKGMEGLYHEPL